MQGRPPRSARPPGSPRGRRPRERCQERLRDANAAWAPDQTKQGSEPVPDYEQPALSDELRALRTSLKRGTAGWDAAMLRAKGQGDQYIRALPAAEGRPQFLVVVDVGHSIELYSELTCTGGTYTPFPAAGKLDATGPIRSGLPTIAGTREGFSKQP